MALSEPELPSGLSSVRWLLCEDERGSAAVEFIVLIPVYVLLLMGLFALAQMSIARQQVAQAARLIAWSPGSRFDDADVERHLFNAHTGTFEVEPQGGDNGEVTFQASQFNPRTVDLGEGSYSEGAGETKIVEIATNLFNNDLPLGPDVPVGGPAGEEAKRVYGNGQRPLKLRKIIVSYTNTGLTLGLNPKSSCSAEVLVWNHKHQRGEVNGVHDANGVANGALTAGAGFSQYHWVGHKKARRDGREDPGLVNNRYLSPDRQTFQGTNTSPGLLNVFPSTVVEKTPGLWNQQARIRGSITAERAFYKSRGP